MLTSLVLPAALAAPVAAEVWDELTPAGGSAPSPRRNATSVYDPVGHRMIVFGGKSATGDVNDVP